MKKFVIYLCIVTLLCSALTLGTSAMSQDVDASTFENLEMSMFIWQTDLDIYSDFNEDYWGFWWEGDVPELETYASACTVNMRGFDMSADGRYMYCGTLNGGTGVRGVVVLDTVTGEVTDLYEKYDGDAGLDGSPYSYAKGIAADDRGYVYVGFAFSLNYNIVNLGIAQQKEDGTLDEVYFDAVYSFGDPGDQGGIKVGVNGVDVVKVGDRYYCYVMTNYAYDALYCLDVTDPANPVLNEDFGKNGVIDFTYDDCPVAKDGFTLDEGQYMDVDEDGVIWLVVNSKEGKDGIMRIAPDGKSCLSVAEVSGAYCVEHENGYLLVGAKSAKTVTVLDDASYEVVATIDVSEGVGDRVTRIRVIDDVLYVCFAGNDSNNNNAIMVGALTGEAALMLEEKAAGWTSEGEAQETDTTADNQDETSAGDDTQAETQAPDNGEVVTDQGVIDVETNAPAQTEKPADEGGCASVLAMAGLMPLLCGAALVLVKKKEN